MKKQNVKDSSKESPESDDSALASPMASPLRAPGFDDTDDDNDHETGGPRGRERDGAPETETEEYAPEDASSDAATEEAAGPLPTYVQGGVEREYDRIKLFAHYALQYCVEWLGDARDRDENEAQDEIAARMGDLVNNNAVDMRPELLRSFRDAARVRQVLEWCGVPAEDVRRMHAEVPAFLLANRTGSRAVDSIAARVSEYARVSCDELRPEDALLAPPLSEMPPVVDLCGVVTREDEVALRASLASRSAYELRAAFYAALKLRPDDVLFDAGGLVADKETARDFPGGSAAALLDSSNAQCIELAAYCGNERLFRDLLRTNQHCASRADLACLCICGGIAHDYVRATADALLESSSRAPFGGKVSMAHAQAVLSVMASLASRWHNIEALTFLASRLDAPLRESVLAAHAQTGCNCLDTRFARDHEDARNILRILKN